MKISIAILSGGLDSTTSLAISLKRRIKCKLAIFFAYGQASAKQEFHAAKLISDHYRIRLIKVDLPFLRMISASRLMEKKTPPKFSLSDLSDKEYCRKMASAVWVPNRNGIFINVAAAYAESLDGKDETIIITGFNAEEAVTFPDNSVFFAAAINSSLRYSASKKVRVISFVQSLSKRQIVKRALELKVPLKLIWSCYSGNSHPCRKCESCIRSIAAFKANNVLSKSRF